MVTCAKMLISTTVAVRLLRPINIKVWECCSILESTDPGLLHASCAGAGQCSNSQVPWEPGQNASPGEKLFVIAATLNNESTLN